MIQQINALAENRVPFLLIVDFEMNMPVIFPLDELPEDIRFSTPSFSSSKKESSPPERIEFHAEPVSYSRYRSAFNLVRENALAGKTYLANLTFPSKIRTNLSLELIYSISQARYRLLYRDRFVVFSPETFVQIKNGKILLIALRE